MGFRTISVEYVISDEEYGRLERIAEAYKEKGLVQTPERAFESIMTCGAKGEIEDRMSLHERWLGINRDKKERSVDEC